MHSHGRGHCSGQGLLGTLSVDLPRMDAQLSRGHGAESYNPKMGLQVKESQKQHLRVQEGPEPQGRCYQATSWCAWVSSPGSVQPGLSSEGPRARCVFVGGTRGQRQMCPGQVHGFIRMLAAEPSSESLMKRPPRNAGETFS